MEILNKSRTDVSIDFSIKKFLVTFSNPFSEVSRCWGGKRPLPGPHLVLLSCVYSAVATGLPYYFQIHFHLMAVMCAVPFDYLV